MPTAAPMKLFKAVVQSTALAVALLGSAPRPATPHFDHAVQLESTAETSANASLGDLDGDGDFDIVLAKGRHWPLMDVVLLNDGKGRFEKRHAVSAKADRSYTAALGDVNGDWLAGHRRGKIRRAQHAVSQLPEDEPAPSPDPPSGEIARPAATVVRRGAEDVASSSRSERRRS